MGDGELPSSNCRGKISVDWIEVKIAVDAKVGELGVSQPGMVAACVTPSDGEFVGGCIDVRAMGRSSSLDQEQMALRRWLRSSHCLRPVRLSDVKDHRIIAAADLTYGYGERRSPYWKRRYMTVFERMDALGLSFVGPQHPNGRHERVLGRMNCPEQARTFLLSATIEKCRQRLSDSWTSYLEISFRVGVSAALNSPDQWGPSDHCRVEIEI